MRAMDLFYYYNGIIYDQPDSRSDSAKGHNIKSISDRIQNNKGKKKCNRDGN